MTFNHNVLTAGMECFFARFHNTKTDLLLYTHGKRK